MSTNIPNHYFDFAETLFLKRLAHEVGVAAFFEAKKRVNGAWPPQALVEELIDRRMRDIISGMVGQSKESQ